MKQSRIAAACIVALSIAGCASVGNAPTFPAQPVKVIIPYPAGNAADIVGRIVVDKLAQTWGQPVSVENRPGQTTIPGVDAVAKARADGYTLLVHSVSYAVDAGLYSGLPYDPDKDLVAVAPFAKQPFALVTSASLGVKSVAELAAKARMTPLKFGSLGPTTQIYFVAEQFRKQAGVSATHVPYKSLVEANEAVAKGDAAFWFPPVAGAMSAIRDGKLAALAVTSAQRVPQLPQVPTMAEAGVKNMESAAWFGLWAPAGVPAAVIDKIAKDVDLALAAPDVREKLTKAGAQPMSMTPAQFARFVNDETESSRQLMKELGIGVRTYAPPAKP
ncbi:tripartite tricarboxylate transporter substrate binding protein [Thauera sp. 2A1]|uniref:Bug family tripartite tricarboxylate transporter substrate binding protein n=1 Tax=Thauera sp. 2A1 TaxID=2570191 RepID=UPI00129285E5|nr:tripartite tricarboxylate transporter substrate-binding protein [Thauera sp. 2A1]KAI5916739.1 tripartite tricarboxylate transporter substrate-binding protein [Thauera sp. 2A1]